jgi:2-oxoglutarate dehydrogenase E1 component
MRAAMLIRTYRVRGHLAADLDPLGLNNAICPRISRRNITASPARLDRKVYLGGTLGLQWATVREIVAILRANYCGKVGLEYMHIADCRAPLPAGPHGRRRQAHRIHPEGKKAILQAVVRGEQWKVLRQEVSAPSASAWMAANP